MSVRTSGRWSSTGGTGGSMNGSRMVSIALILFRNDFHIPKACQRRGVNGATRESCHAPPVRSPGEVVVERGMVMANADFLVFGQRQQVGDVGLEPALHRFEVVHILLQDQAEGAEFGNVHQRITFADLDRG